MDEKRLTEKKHFAGEKKPSMKRRDDFNDYHDHRMYMITIEVAGRQPLLGTVVGNPDAPDGSDGAPHVVPTALGKRVEQEWRGIPNYYPQIEVMAFQLMPDHIHGILFVHDRIPLHLGHVIGGFKTGCNRAVKELAATSLLAAAQPQPPQNPAAPFCSSVPSSSAARSSSAVPSSPPFPCRQRLRRCKVPSPPSPPFLCRQRLCRCKVPSPPSPPFLCRQRLCRCKVPSPPSPPFLCRQRLRRCKVPSPSAATARAASLSAALTT